MGISYTREETLAELTSVLAKGTDFLYNSNPVNWRGCIKGTNMPYTEEIIKELYDRNIFVHGVIIEGINEIKREESYYTKSHEDLVIARNKNSNRDEEIFVKELFTNNPFEAELGKVVDFQIPLKDKLDDSAGKIDLLTFNENTSEMFIVEVKKDGSEETALRCCLEVQTYLQKIEDIEKFVSDFYNAGKIPTKDLKIKLAVTVFNNSVPANEFKDETREYLQKLVKDFDIKVCYA